VLDTVDIYFLASRQRRLSLRFLTWIVLKEQIQQDTHDSIEDARSALKLWQAFLKFEEDGVWDQKLEELYREGKKVVSGFGCLGRPGMSADVYSARLLSRTSSLRKLPFPLRQRRPQRRRFRRLRRRHPYRRRCTRPHSSRAASCRRCPRPSDFSTPTF
jgi:hypothetical protein